MGTKTKTKKLYYSLAFLILASFFTSLIMPISVSAVDANDSGTNPDHWYPQTRAKRWAYLTGLYNCIDNNRSAWQDSDFLLGPNNRIDENNAASGNWWLNPAGPQDYPDEAAGFVGISPPTESGRYPCDKVVNIVADEYGYSPIQLLCLLGGEREDGSPCTGSTGSQFKPPQKGKRLNISSVWGSSSLPQSAGGAAYAVLNYEALVSSNGCGLKPVQGKPTGKFYYKVTVVDNSTGKPVERYYTGKDRDHEVAVYTSYPGINEQKRKCSQIATDASKYSADYAAWIRNHKEADIESEANTDSDATDDGETACGIEGGLGWILCPVINTMANIADSLFGFLADEFLFTSPTLFDRSSAEGEAMFAAWSRFRDIANVAFVIFFIIVVYSQVTGAGLSNYGIKKSLPKLLVAAIMVNASFWVCAIAVDLSNIIGYSAKSLFDSVGSAPKIQGTVSDSALTQEFGWSSIATLVLAGTVVWLSLSALIGFLGMAVVVLIVIVLILLIRKALIILLIALAPLAFVTYMLPNTKEWFDKWRKAFVALLMIFPIIGVVFGASALASLIVQATGDDNLTKILGAAIAVIPLIIVPGLIKGSLSMLGQLGAKLSGYADKAQGGAAARGKEKYKKSALGQYQAFRSTEKDKRRAMIQSGQYKGRGGILNPRNVRSSVFGAVNARAGKFGDRMTSTGLRTVDEEYENDVKGAALKQYGMTNQQVAEIAKTGKHDGRQVTEHELAAAQDRIMSTGSFDERREALEFIAANKSDKRVTENVRARAVNGSIKRGDANIYGKGFGNEIISNKGAVTSKESLAQQAVKNAQGGNVSAEHLVQSDSATEYVVAAVTGGSYKTEPLGVSGDPAAAAKVKAASIRAQAPDSQVADKVSPRMRTAFGGL